MRITTNVDKLYNELSTWLRKEIERRGAEIVDGVDVTVYRERVAEVRALQEVFTELPQAMKRAIDK